MNLIALDCVSVNTANNSALNHADSSPSLLLGTALKISRNKEGTLAGEEFFGIGEVDAVLADIGSILLVVPFEVHCNALAS
jgi:hypothetical protein